MLLTNCSLVSMRDEDPGVIRHAAIAVDGGTVRWAGAAKDLPASLSRNNSVDMEGRLVTPGLIDCHTHLVFGGNRAAEFEQRLQGVDYAAIARAGGGILSTVRATRAAPGSTLLKDALGRADCLMAEGVTTVEIKSGYGLDQDTELKMLRVARAISEQRMLDVRTTYLGAHALPEEFSSDPDAYTDTVCIPVMRRAASEGLIDAVDGFCEEIAFDADQIGRVFEAARSLGLPVKLHAEQLSHQGGVALAAQYGAMSVDHIEYAREPDVALMAQAGMTAVLLPGAFYTLGETQRPPVAAMRRAEVPMAVATDCNPGSSPLTSPLLAMNMACTLFGLTPDEALRGMTINAARALRLPDRGQVAPGLRADLCVWDVDTPAELAYRIGFNPLHQRYCQGEPSWKP